MAFNGIGGSVERRRTNLESLKQTTKGATDIARMFMKEMYGATVARTCLIRYADNTMTIQTTVKKVSRDLVLRSGELSAVVRAEKFPLKRIVIG